MTFQAIVFFPNKNKKFHKFSTIVKVVYCDWCTIKVVYVEGSSDVALVTTCQ